MQFYLNQICLKNNSMNIYHFPLTVNHKFFRISSTIQIAQHAFFSHKSFIFKTCKKTGAENLRIFHSCFLLIFVYIYKMLGAKDAIRIVPYFVLPQFYLYNYSSSVVSSGRLMASPSSSNCFSSTVPGASVIRQEASFTFGNAMTSRMESACTICITIRSKP